MLTFSLTRQAEAMALTSIDQWGPAVVADGLTKAYGDHTVVDRLTMELPAAAVTGFAGPNGSGKTTTMRMLLGLIQPTSGTAEVLGESIATPERYLSKVGALIEGPAFHPTMSGRDNLRVLTKLAALANSRIDEVLDQVGLGDRGHDRYASYSLGMKQRLGLASALLTHPKLVMLDEPTNGLDPEGIREMRVLLEQLAADGVSIFVSSHLLSEVQAVCSHILLIQEGRLRFQGSIGELLSTQTTELLIAAELPTENVGLAAVLESRGYAVTLRAADLLVKAPLESAANLNRAASASGITLARIEHHLPNLEAAFFAVTEESA